MRRSIQVGLGLALTGGLLTVGCGDRWPWTHVPIDEGPGSTGPGSHPDAGGGTPPPQVAAPRLVAPLSGSLTATNRPLFRWQPAAGADGTLVEICADRACQTVTQQVSASGASASASGPLPAGHVFWRARHTVHGASTGAASPTWELFVPHRDGAQSGALAIRLDYDGDGFGDFALDDRVVLGGPNGYQRSFPLVGPTPPADATFFAPAGDLNGRRLRGCHAPGQFYRPVEPHGDLQPHAALRRSPGVHGRRRHHDRSAAGRDVSLLTGGRRERRRVRRLPVQDPL